MQWTALLFQAGYLEQSEKVTRVWKFISYLRWYKNTKYQLENSQKSDNLDVTGTNIWYLVCLGLIFDDVVLIDILLIQISLKSRNAVPVASQASRKEETLFKRILKDTSHLFFQSRAFMEVGDHTFMW